MSETGLHIFEIIFFNSQNINHIRATVVEDCDILAENFLCQRRKIIHTLWDKISGTAYKSVKS